MTVMVERFMEDKVLSGVFHNALVGVTEQNELEDLNGVSKPHTRVLPTAGKEVSDTGNCCKEPLGTFEGAGLSEALSFNVYRPLIPIPSMGIPGVVSIGRHHRYKALDFSDEKKELCVISVISRRPETSLEDYNKAIREIEPDLRKLYPDLSNLTSDEFVERMILDGCFILYIVSESKSNENIIGFSKWKDHKIQEDLVLFGNQIPFIVLRRLFDLSKPPTQTLSLIQLIVNFFASRLPTIQQATISPDLKGEHILDLLRNHLVEPSGVCHTSVKIEKERKLGRWIPSATALKADGVKIKKKTTNTGFLDITFRDGVLEVPPFDTQSGYLWTVLLPNMIALEQSHRVYKDIITSYALFMTHLIKSEEDVYLLRDEGVITGFDGNDHVVISAIGELCKQLNVGTFYYEGLCSQVNVYRKTTRIGRIAKQVLEYLIARGSLLAVAAAIVVVGLAIAKTVIPAS